MRFHSVITRNLRLPAAAALCAAVLLSGIVPAAAEEIAVEDLAPDEETIYEPSAPQDAFDVEDGALFEDTGDEIIDTAGLSSEALIQESETAQSVVVIPNLEDAQPDRIRASLDSLLQTPSPTGSEGELVIAQYIEYRMKELGYAVQEQAFHEGVLNEEGIDPPGVNIIAERGADAKQNRTGDILLLVTHYDSKRGAGASDPYANDKTGAAVLLETARILANIETDTDLCFLFLSGQEDGGFGAQRFIESLSEENRSRIRHVVTVDRVGYDTGMPVVVGRLTGEVNEICRMLRECGIADEVATAALNGTLTQLEFSMLEATAAQNTLAQNNGAQNNAAQDNAAQDGISQNGTDRNSALPDPFALTDTNLGGEQNEQDPDIGSETEAETPLPLPIPWSILMDDSSAQSAFSSASFAAVGLTQYDPDLDAERHRQTLALFPADTSAEDYLWEIVEARETLAPGVSNAPETSADGIQAGAAGAEADGRLGAKDDSRTVIPVLRGLGSYPGVQAMFLDRAVAAEKG